MPIGEVSVDRRIDRIADCVYRAVADHSVPATWVRAAENTRVGFGGIVLLWWQHLASVSGRAISRLFEHGLYVARIETSEVVPGVHILLAHKIRLTQAVCDVLKLNTLTRTSLYMRLHDSIID